MTPSDPRSNAYSWVDDDDDGRLDTSNVDRLKRRIAEVQAEHSAHLQQNQLTEQTPFQLPVKSIRAVQPEQTSTVGQAGHSRQVDASVSASLPAHPSPRFIAAKGQTSSSLSNGSNTRPSQESSRPVQTSLSPSNGIQEQDSRPRSQTSAVQLYTASGIPLLSPSASTGPREASRWNTFAASVDPSAAPEAQDMFQALFSGSDKDAARSPLKRNRREC